jgi:uncharacterized membrane protein YdjX (TVP38/TMEM64 family)
MKRALLFVVGIAGIVILSKLLVENVAGVDLSAHATAWITEPGIVGAVAVVALLAVDVVAPVPSSAVMVLSGLAFGVLWGSVLSIAGSVVGSWIGFELVRHYGRAAALRFVDAATLGRLQTMFHRYGSAVLVLSRALPIMMETMSLVAGLSAMKRSTFLLASVTGTVPVAIVYAYAGSVSRDTGSAVPAIVILVAMTGAAALWYRSRVGSDDDAAAKHREKSFRGVFRDG